MSRDTVHIVNDTVREGRDAGNNRDDAGAERRMTAKALLLAAKSLPLTVEQLRESVEALTSEGYPHRPRARRRQRPLELGARRVRLCAGAARFVSLHGYAARRGRDGPSRRHGSAWRRETFAWRRRALAWCPRTFTGREQRGA